MSRLQQYINEDIKEYKPGDKVLVFDIAKSKWRPAVLLKRSKPYYNKTSHKLIDQFEYRWDDTSLKTDLTTGITPSFGGTTSSQHIKPRR